MISKGYGFLKLRKEKKMSNIHNDAIKELLFESAMTTLLKQGKPYNETTELEAVEMVAQEWEKIEGY